MAGALGWHPRRWRRGRALVAAAAALAVVGLPTASLRPTAEAAGQLPARAEKVANSAVPAVGLDSGAFDDEFNGPAGAPPDPQLWQIQTGGGGWGNNELQTYTSNPDNVSLDGHGHLVITLRKDPSVGYTSGRIASAVLLPTYGHFEARIKMPAGDGLWPCFWLMGLDPSGATWPYTGEIDVGEMASEVPSIQYASVHGPRLTPGPDTRLSPNEVAVDRHWFVSYLLRYGRPITDGFHDFAVDTSAGRITFSFDGKPYETVTTSATPLGGFWPFDVVRYYLILDLAIGGRFAGDPNASTPFPSSMVVDYVRVTPSS